MSTHGVINLASSHSVPETADRLERFLQTRGMTIFARIDQAAEAAKVGLSLRPMILIIFGDPKTGTPLMEQFPTLAVDLPLKALIWESEGKVYLSYTSPGHLQKRHELPITPFPQLDFLMSKSLNS